MSGISVTVQRKFKKPIIIFHRSARLDLGLQVWLLKILSWRTERQPLRRIYLSPVQLLYRLYSLRIGQKWVNRPIIKSSVKYTLRHLTGQFYDDLFWKKNSGHSNQGSQDRTTSLSHKQKNFFFVFFTYSRKYFCFYVVKCQSEVCVILFLNAIAP